MKVFISWSGSLSHQVAVALRDWLPSALQIVEPYVSSEDIDKGARWSTDISRELEHSSFGIICVTPENIEAPWVNFEAGALSKSLDRSRVAPLLFGIDRLAVQGPLLQFQSTLIERDEVKKLLLSIDKACDDHALGESRVGEVFDVWWPHLQERLDELQQAKPRAKTPNRPSGDVLAEVLELARGQQKLLATPEALLPPGYIDWAIREAREVSSGASDADLVAMIEDVMDLWSQLDQNVDREREQLPARVLEPIARLSQGMIYLDRYLRARRRKEPADARAEAD
ncbi:MAG: toll/interleukin-1 receptor domain-containing protein [Solirubrobacterales bacterium]